ncbi:MAG TPA: hypothetical protein VMO26_13935 [Vicinamibacterales bacterium]|nr:hypothetical protein [Vicinamibacterales bacterium]
MDTSRLPGGELIARGLQDLADNVESPAALLIVIGAPRLQRLGVVIPPSPLTETGSPEHRLYALLAAGDTDSAHSRYNALIRTLVSFERAAECVS